MTNKDDIIRTIQTLLDILYDTGYERIDITREELEDILELIKNQDKEIEQLWSNVQWLRGTGIKPM